MNNTFLQSKKFMSSSFQKSRYDWTLRPKMKFASTYGIYVNIPFCTSFCNFCPFYKVEFESNLVSKYVKKLVSEIESQPLPGDPQWIYFGGGTPNLLTVRQLKDIVGAIKSKVAFQEAGIELLPRLVNYSYLHELKEIGFKKISLGVESLQPEVNRQAGRKTSDERDIERVISWAQSLGFYINTDLMVGLKGQTGSLFLSDMERICELRPTQVTIYPFMVIRGLHILPEIGEEEQFQLIETSARILIQSGYKRLGPWTFSNASGEYDCSKAELVCDYAGFGAGSFSTNAGLKVVNPPVAYYVNQDLLTGMKALVGKKSPTADQWRRFGWMLSDLNTHADRGLSMAIRIYLVWLRLQGYYNHKGWSEKGIMLAHHLLKTTVESLPFPIQDTKKISNRDEYLRDVAVEQEEQQLQCCT